MPHPVDIYVGKRLRMRRTMLGMSQEALGRAIGVTFQQIQKYERGVNRMGSSRLFDFARILNVPVAFYFEGYEDEQQEKSEAAAMSAAYPGLNDGADQDFEHERLTSRETLELMRAYHRISDNKTRKRIAELIKTMAGEKAA
ncbi:MAG: helix-turn-helix domain-containing protein [Rickettsiales bacterium]|nr:helix-turn-helix domain-containing protein [Rickettsiales bacterium]